MTTLAEFDRDAGMAQAENATDPRLMLAVDKKIAEFNATGERWSANDLRDALPVVAGPLIGARMNAAANRKPTEMKRVGMTRSSLRSTRHAWIAVWQGVTT